MPTLQRTDWDKDQLTIIEAGHNQRLLVEAGPGTGKTAVACARIAHLVGNEGVAEPNIWMISFTRAAVGEIRSRLRDYVGEAAFSIKVATVDAHAWTIHSGYDPNAKLTGSYEENIDRVIELICTDDIAREEIKYVEHLVVDEAQDLVGNRAQLVETLIEHLDLECGVTVFADSAQAIYGFSEDDTGKGLAEVTTLSDLLIEPQKDFEVRRLNTVHRTSSPSLKRIFGDVRESILAEIENPEGLFTRTRDSINEHADQTGLTPKQLELDSVPINSLVLFRSRAEALHYSQFCNRPHGLRLSGFGSHLPAWLAICLSNYTEPAISEDVFLSLWATRVESAIVPNYGPSEAWERLLRAGSNRDGSVSMKKLRARLSRNPPIDLCEPIFGLPGPVIGTIHASKGREADHVTMLIPRQESFQYPAVEAEETRVLFVGATRAREKLIVGQAGAYPGTKLDGERAYRRVPKNKTVAMIEIGRPNDLPVKGIAGRKDTSEHAFLDSQKHLERHSSVVMSLELRADPRMDWRYRIIVPETGLCVGIMSDTFNGDLWDISEELSSHVDNGKLRPNNTIKYVRCLGSRTVVVSEDDPELETLHPMAAQPGFILAPMIASFTNVYFNFY